jgi:hypothetical protein
MNTASALSYSNGRRITSILDLKEGNKEKEPPLKGSSIGNQGPTAAVACHSTTNVEVIHYSGAPKSQPKAQRRHPKYEE